MAEFKRYKGHDYRYRNKQKDNPPAVDLGQSILELRRIYKDYTDAEFAAWYAGRYGVRPEGVAAVLNANKAHGLLRDH